MTTATTTTEKYLPLVSPQATMQEPPSGFILKLNQMIHGAPDEVIHVSFLRLIFSVVVRQGQDSRL
jgi:hypothetical protein